MAGMMTVKEFFEKYPGISKQSVADALGIDRSSLSAKVNGSGNKKLFPEDVKAIQDYLNNLGRELVKIKLEL